MNTVLKPCIAALPPTVHQEAAAFAKKIATRLWKLRLTRKEIPDVVARAVNIPPVLLQKIESGRHNFTLNILFRLCDYYKVNPDDIVCNDKLWKSPGTSIMFQ